MRNDSLGIPHRIPPLVILLALFVPLVLALALVPARAQAKSFSDVGSGDWYSEYVTYVSDKSLMTGYTDGTNRFAPEDTVTRAMVATVLYRFATGDAGTGGTSSTFKDVASKQWYTKAVEWCYAKGVVTGDKDASGKITGYFRPNDPVSREELGVMLYRFANLYGYVTGSETWSGVSYVYSSGGVMALYGFRDYNDISDWARDGARWCQYNGIITGYDSTSRMKTMKPKNSATRAEMAKMLTVFCRDVFGGSATTSSYELYVVGQEDLTPYTGTRTVLFVKTDAAISDQLKLVDKTEPNLTVKSVDTFSDITFTDSEATAGGWRAVKGGWVLFCYFNVAGTHTLQLCNGNRVLHTFTVQVADYDAAQDAWIDAVIAKCTTSSMDSFAKMTAVENWLRAHFTYLDNRVVNGTDYLVYLASRNVPYFVSYQWDSYVSPAVLVKFANKIGGFDSVTNMYYASSGSDWSMMHFRVKCVKGSTTEYYQACPATSTGWIKTWDMIDFTDPSSYLHFDSKVLRHIPGGALSTYSLDEEETTYDEVDALSTEQVQDAAEGEATFDDVSGEGATYDAATADGVASASSEDANVQSDGAADASAGDAADAAAGEETAGEDGATDAFADGFAAPDASADDAASSDSADATFDSVEFSDLSLAA